MSVVSSNAGISQASGSNGAASGSIRTGGTFSGTYSG